MAELSRVMPLTGDADFDARIMQFSDEQDPVRLEELRQAIEPSTQRATTV